jgi:hypothetical protein
MNTVYFDSDADEAERRSQLYAGQLYVYSPTKSGVALCNLAQELCEQAFHPHFPPDAQHHLGVEQYVDILKTLKPKFIHHPECKHLIPQLLEELGCRLEFTYFDVPRLRTACSGDYLSSGLAYAFKPHRDTWYSTPMAQLNWWLPVYPIASDNAMAFHPNYWDKPIPNSSSLFNYQDWNLVGRKSAEHQVGKDTRVQSAALEPMKLEPQTRLVTKPGGVIAFSAAQMHSTVPNMSGLTRFSIDFRTVDSRDTSCDRGAPNIDSECNGTTMMDYLRGTDWEHFPEAEIKRQEMLILEPRFPTPKRQVLAELQASKG